MLTTTSSDPCAGRLSHPPCLGTFSRVYLQTQWSRAVTASIVPKVAGKDRVVAVHVYPQACIAIHHLWLARHISSDVQDGLAGCVRRVGRRRGGGCPLLFRRPLPTPDVHLSAYPAFQCLTAGCPAGPQAVVALGISPTSLPACHRHLPPFPLYTAFPCAEYDGGAVALRLATRRAIPHSLDARRVERDVGGPFAPLRGVMLPRPLCGRFGRTPLSRPITEAPPVDVVAEDGCLHPWRLSFVQCRSRPSARVLQNEAINVF